VKSAVTVSLVAEAKGGPFVFSNGLADACEQAAKIGFSAIEIFPRSAKDLDLLQLRILLDKHRLELAAVGTGGGWVLHQMHLCHREAAVRAEARRFIRAIIDAAGVFSAPAIVGSLQGRVEGEVSREEALLWLREALEELGEYALEHQQTLLFEPLNRYETNLFNRLGDVAEFLESLQTRNLRILADLFHMNIEETDLGGAIREAGRHIGHVHFADSNRRAVGFGHTDMVSAVRALRHIGYKGYLSAEVFPLPDSTTAAEQSLSAFQECTRR